jgi:hypothetical protein
MIANLELEVALNCHLHELREYHQRVQKCLVLNTAWFKCDLKCVPLRLLRVPVDHCAWQLTISLH